MVLIVAKELQGVSKIVTPTWLPSDPIPGNPAGKTGNLIISGNLAGKAGNLIISR